MIPNEETYISVVCYGVVSNDVTTGRIEFDTIPVVCEDATSNSVAIRRFKDDTTSAIFNGTTRRKTYIYF